MVAVPAQGTFTDPNVKNGDAKASLDAMVDIATQGHGTQVVTIISGSITPANAMAKLAPESGTTDVLDTIQPDNIPEGGRVTIGTSSAGTSITVTHLVSATTSGRISLAYATNEVLDNPRKKITFHRVGDSFEEINRTGFPVGSGSGSGADPGEIDNNTVVNAGFSFAATHKRAMTGVDASVTNPLIITVGSGVDTPAGKSIIGFFKKTTAAGTVQVRKATSGSGGVPPVVGSGKFDYSTNSATIGNNNFTPIDVQIPVPIGNGLWLCVAVMVNYLNTATRVFNATYEGNPEAWTNKIENPTGDSNPSIYFMNRPLGDVPAAVNKRLQLVAGNTGGVRTVIVWYWITSGTDQVTPYEALSANFGNSSSSITRGDTTSGPNRNILYGFARIGAGAGTLALTGATQLSAYTTGSSNNKGNMETLQGREDAPTVGDYGATATFTGSQPNSYFVVAARPAPGSTFTLDTPGDLDVNITQKNKVFAIVYDGNNNAATVMA
jgi:hypothetical protein